MEFLEEEDARPRFRLQGGDPAPPSAPEPLRFEKIHAAACLSAAAALLASAYFLLASSQTLASLLAWAALSLILAPFAPASVTGGDVRVGRGPPIPSPSADLDDPQKPIPTRRVRSRKPDDLPPPPNLRVSNGSRETGPDQLPSSNGASTNEERTEEESDGEWRDEDFDLLKRQIVKHPVGEPQRWEKIAEAFKGRHRLESVIRMAKSLPERRPGGGDSFQQFLKQRKPIDTRLEAINGDSKGDILVGNSEPKASDSWSSREDLALLNALKAFPKDATMRWEKIAAAVPGKSKASCMKRVAELKKGFRSSKAS